MNIATLASLVFAAKQLMSSNSASSASLSLKLDDAIKEISNGLDRSYLKSEDTLLVGDLLNVCEVACSLIIDKSVHGASKQTLVRSINSSLNIISSNGYLMEIVKDLKIDDAIYIHIYYYLIDAGICPQMRAALMPIRAVVRPNSRTTPWIPF